MKKTNILLAFTAGLGLFSLFSSCDFELPSSVSVKTDATYNFSIGDIEHDFNDSFDKDALFTKLENEYNKIYDYFPGKKEEKKQQFLVEVKIPPIPIPALPEGTTYSLPPINFDIDMDIASIFNTMKDSFGEDFVQYANFTSIPLYIYCAKPKVFSSSTLKGNVLIHYIDEDENDFSEESNVLIGSSDEQISYTVMPELDKVNIGKTENVVISDLLDNKSSLSADLGNLLNLNRNNKGKLRLTFNLSFEATASGESGELSLSSYIAIPLQFISTADLNINIKNMVNKDSDDSGDVDIFKRGKDTSTDTSNFDKYLDAIENIVLGYRTSKNPFVTDSCSLVIKSVWPKINEELEINVDEVKLTCEEFTRILHSENYNPDINLKIPNDTLFSIARDISLKMNVYIALETNGTIKF